MSEDGTRGAIPREEVRKITDGEKIVLKNLRRLLNTISGEAELAADMLTNMNQPDLGRHFSHDCDDAINNIFGDMNLLEISSDADEAPTPK
jgi:hypothetical protein